MSFKDIADVIKKYTGEDIDSGDKPEKSKTARAFELLYKVSSQLKLQ
jgi:hypothetical protein